MIFAKNMRLSDGETRFSLRRTEEIYMSKKYYPIEDAVNNVSQKFKLGLKDANETC